MASETIFGIAATAVTFDQATYYVPEYAAHRPVSQQILSGKYAEPDLHDLVARVMAVRPGSMVHAGTFFGDMLPSFAAKCTDTLYAFEPVVENYLLARQTVAVNRLRNVVLHHAALGRKPGVASVLTHNGDVHRGGGSRVVADDSGQQATPLLSVDQFAIANLSLIQLDVEGSEEAALAGAADTISRSNPVIVIEDNRANCATPLARMGYTPRHKIHRNTLYLTDALAAEFAL